MIQVDGETFEQIANDFTAFLTILNDLEKGLLETQHKEKTHCQRFRIIITDMRNQFRKFTVINEKEKN